MSIRDMIMNVFLQQLSLYAKEGEGNIVISQENAKDIANRVADILHRSISRPVVTVSHADILHLGQLAGFIPVTHKHEGEKHHALYVRDEVKGTDIFPLVEYLIDLTVKFTLEEVGRGTVPRKGIV